MSGIKDVCEYTGITGKINLFMSFLNSLIFYEFYDFFRLFLFFYCQQDVIAFKTFCDDSWLATSTLLKVAMTLFDDISKSNKLHLAVFNVMAFYKNDYRHFLIDCVYRFNIKYDLTGLRHNNGIFWRKLLTVPLKWWYFLYKLDLNIVLS